MQVDNNIKYDSKKKNRLFDKNILQLTINKILNANEEKNDWKKNVLIHEIDRIKYKNEYTKENRVEKYDPMNKCKSAGIIPYTLMNGKIYFLFQIAIDPIRKKNIGWNDFGGKHNNDSDSTAITAAREFSEETSCLFYLKELNTNETNQIYDLLKNNDKLIYDDNTVEILKKILPLSQDFFYDKITEYAVPIYVSSKNIYISYFVNVKYINENELPVAEDIHIPYETRYIRKCKWFSYDEIIEMNEHDFHKRLQITKIQNRITKYYNRGLFT